MLGAKGMAQARTLPSNFLLNSLIVDSTMPTASAVEYVGKPNRLGLSVTCAPVMIRHPDCL